VATATATRKAPKVAKKENPTGITTEVVTVDPDAATELLELNSHNRPLKPTVVERFARDMREGRWLLTGDALKISRTNVLLDGQHRLAAIVKSGVPVQMLVVRGIDDEAQIAMDTGIKRSHADALTLRGETQTAALASTARLSMLYLEGRLFSESRYPYVSAGELVEFIEKNPDVRDAARFGQTFSRRSDLPPSVGGTAYLLFTRIDVDAGEDFFERLAARVDLPPGSPVLALDSRLRQIRRSKTHVEQRHVLRLVLKAWNYERDGKLAKSLYLAPRTSNFSTEQPH